MVKQYDKILVDCIFLVFDNFNSGARLGCLNRFSVNNFIPNTFMAIIIVFGASILFTHCIFGEAIVFLVTTLILLSTTIINDNYI